LFQIQNQKQNPPLGGSADPVVFSGFNSLGTQATGVGTPPDVNTARNGSVVMLSYNTKLLLSTDGASTYTLVDLRRFFRAVPPRIPTATSWITVSAATKNSCTFHRSIASFGSSNFAEPVRAGVSPVSTRFASRCQHPGRHQQHRHVMDLLGSRVCHIQSGTTTMDYPDLSVGDNFIYFSADAVGKRIACGPHSTERDQKRIDDSHELHVAL